MDIFSFTTISVNQADQIANLLNINEWSRPGIPYTAEELLKEPEGYFLCLDSQRNVIGTARLKKVSWYQWDFGSLVVSLNHRRQGIAESLIKAAEEHALSHKGVLIQTTVDPKNIASQSLLKKRGWSSTTSFIHPYYKERMEVWNKSISLK